MLKSFIEENVSSSVQWNFLVSFLIYLSGNCTGTQFVPDQSNVLAKPAETAVWWKKIRYSCSHSPRIQPAYILALVCRSLCGEIIQNQSKGKVQCVQVTVWPSQCMGFYEFIMVLLSVLLRINISLVCTIRICILWFVFRCHIFYQIEAFLK